MPPDVRSADLLVHRRTPAFFRVDARIEKRWAFAGGEWIGATFE